MLPLSQAKVHGHGPAPALDGGSTASCTALTGKQLESTPSAEGAMTMPEEELRRLGYYRSFSPEDAIANAAKAFGAAEGETEASAAAPAEQTKTGKLAAAKAETKQPAKESPVCGPSADQALDDKPSSGLCSTGKASKIEGTGPWSWSCATKEGKKALCVALLKRDGSCGPVNGAALGAAPTSDLCSFGAASAVAGTGPWTWSCIGIGGGDSSQLLGLCPARKIRLMVFAVRRLKCHQ